MAGLQATWIATAISSPEFPLNGDGNGQKKAPSVSESTKTGKSRDAMHTLMRAKNPQGQEADGQGQGHGRNCRRWLPLPGSSEGDSMTRRQEQNMSAMGWMRMWATP